MTFEELKEILELVDFEVKNFDGNIYFFYGKNCVAHFYEYNINIYLTSEFYDLPNVKKANVLSALAVYIEELPEKNS